MTRLVGKRLIVGIFLFVILMTSLPLWASAQTFLFWYPGAEGTPEQATPILETLTQYIAQKGLPDHPLTAVYRNDSVSEGLEKIKKIKPVIAIVSPEAYLYLTNQHSLTLLAQTRNQASGQDMIHYAVFQHKDLSRPETLVMTEPLTESFARNIVLRNAPKYRKLPLKFVSQALFNLKKIGRGELPAAILLNDYEEAVLARMKAPWRETLVKVVTSPKLPSPPLIVFNDWKKDFPAEKLLQVLMKMKEDPEGAEILKELRLVGFSEPNTSDYEALRASIAAP